MHALMLFAEDRYWKFLKILIKLTEKFLLHHALLLNFTNLVIRYTLTNVRNNG